MTTSEARELVKLVYPTAYAANIHGWAIYHEHAGRGSFKQVSEACTTEGAAWVSAAGRLQ